MADPNPPTSGTTSPMTSAVSALRGKEGTGLISRLLIGGNCFSP